ncbi:MAG: hypothetical protein DVB31_05450 [Verrucomicrobia bacterium]|nr:MAG: hypothetical protein DVB31_05450 [Verrucomicrobiota bacterium]
MSTLATTTTNNASRVLEAAGASGATAAALFADVNVFLQTIIATATVVWWLRLLWIQKNGAMPAPPNLKTPSNE